MGDSAPSDKELNAVKLKTVKTNEAHGEVNAEDKKPFLDIWKKNGGDFSKVKKDDRFKGMAWRHNFEPKDGDAFAVGILTGLAFDD